MHAKVRAMTTWEYATVPLLFMPQADPGHLGIRRLGTGAGSARPQPENMVAYLKRPLAG